LFVEDSEDDRQMYGQFLSRQGFRVSTAADGKEGLEKAFQLLPDVVLLDLWLPEIGGWEATRRLKSDERTSQIPVVIITGYSYVHADVVGCDGFLVKPCLLPDLQAEINRVLKARDQREQAELNH